MTTKILKYPKSKIVQATAPVKGGEKISFLDIKTRRKSSKIIPIPKGYVVDVMKNDNTQKKITLILIRR